MHMPLSWFSHIAAQYAWVSFGILKHHKIRDLLWQILSSVDNLCKQSGPRSGPLLSGSSPFDSQMTFSENFFLEMFIFEKHQQRTKEHAKLTSMQSVKENLIMLVKYIHSLPIHVFYMSNVKQKGIPRLKC